MGRITDKANESLTVKVISSKARPIDVTTNGIPTEVVPYTNSEDVGPRSATKDERSVI